MKKILAPNSLAPSLLPTVHAVEPLETRIAPATIFAVDTADNLLQFDSATPGVVTSLAITGLGAGEQIADLDIRPATGELYALSIEDTAGPDAGRIYKINPATGVATQVGAAPFSTTLTDGTNYGFDFNPAADRIRIVNTADENLRVHPDTGALVGAGDTGLTYTVPATGPVIEVAYDRNGADATVTTLFGIDSGADQLVMIGGVDGSPSPNLGAVTAVGALGIDVIGVAGFDIQNATETAYAALDVGGTTRLYTVNLTTGLATLAGTIGAGGGITGLAVAMPGATLVNARTATFTDVDGDTARVTVSQGTLGTDDFTFATMLNGGNQLLRLNLSDDGVEFDGASLRIAVTQRAAGGDGEVHVGYINSTGNDLNKVVVGGDLAQIDAGNATTTTPGLGALHVRSLGRWGVQTEAPVSTSLVSNINGALSRLFVKGDMIGATVSTSGGLDGRLGTATIRGSLIGGGVPNSGAFIIDGDIGRITIGGNVEGAAGSSSASIFSFEKIGRISIGGALLGGAGIASGSITATGEIVSIKIGGDMRGGAGLGSGSIVNTFGGVSRLSIGGSLEGGRGDASGAVLTSGDIGRLAIGGDFVGGSITGTDSTLTQSGYIETEGRIGWLTIGGSFITGTDSSAAGVLDSSGTVRVGDDIGRLTVHGSIVGNADSIATIVARGRDVPAATTDVAIGRISVGGRVEFANILAGYDRDVIGVNADAQIGSVRVGGAWIASSLVAGADAGADTFFGTADDALLSGGGVTDTARNSRIASITIGGLAIGTPESTSALDAFGFVAEQVGALKVHGVAIAHSAGLHNSNVLVGATGDFRLLEV